MRSTDEPTHAIRCFRIPKTPLEFLAQCTCGWCGWCAEADDRYKAAFEHLDKMKATA